MLNRWVLYKRRGQRRRTSMPSSSAKTTAVACSLVSPIEPVGYGRVDVVDVYGMGG